MAILYCVIKLVIFGLEKHIISIQVLGVPPPWQFLFLFWELHWYQVENQAFTLAAQPSEAKSNGI